MSTIAKLSRNLATILPEIGGGNFCRLLCELLKDLAPIDEVSVIVYEPGVLPAFEFADPEPREQANLDIFVNGAFLLDPYYIAATEQGQSGFFRMRDVAPPGFRQSEYYRAYYKRSGLSDECGYLLPVGKQSFVNIALGRIAGAKFNKAHSDLLADVTPTIDALCRAHWSKGGRQAKRSGRLRKQLDSALQYFGSSVLTAREREVVHLILTGHTTKKLATVLGISPETVKLHRKHAYAKLRVGTQAELFYLFIDALKNVKGSDGGDPLVAYARR